MKKLIVSIALLASCEGRCRPSDALTEVVPGGLCGTTLGQSQGICLQGDEVFVCSIDGAFFNVASCKKVGVLCR